MKRAQTDDIMAFHGVNAWVRAAALCHFNISPLLMQAGLYVDSKGTHHIPRQGLVELMMQCVAQGAPTHHFPLMVGDAFVFDAMPSIETFLAAAPTVRQAMPVLGWASSLLPGLTAKFETEGSKAAIVIQIEHRDSDPPKAAGYFVELVTASIAKFGRMVLGGEKLAIGVDLMHDPGPLRSLCEMQFGAPIHVQQARNALVINSAMLDRRLPGALPEFHEQLQGIISQQLAEDRHESRTEQLVHLFKDDPRLMGQGIQKMADILSLHPRTLQRRLKEEGQIFGDILTRCRHEHAIAQLKVTHIDIDALSATMGFTDRTSFTRAFKEWTGMTPTDYRRQCLAESRTNAPDPGRH